MRPLLVSLALLLLALCRQADSASNAAQEMLQKIRNFESKKDEIADNIGEYGTLFAMYHFWSIEDDPRFNEREKSLDNGVLCLLEDTTIGATITNKLYGNTGRIAEETDVAKGLFLIDCAVSAAGTPEWDCFCTKQSTIFFCAAHIFKKKHITAPKGKCKKEALEELKLAGTKTLGKYYDYNEIVEKKKDENNVALKAVASEDASAVDKIISDTPEAAKFYCDAINPDVETKVKALFATDASFSAVEVFVAVALFGPDGLDSIKNACKNDAEYKSNHAFGSCACAGDKGILFCLYKTLGKAFKEAGYLDCAADKLVDAKKPSAVPQMKPKSAPAPTPAGGNGTATTTAATASAAPSSLLLAPLAAAAAAMLLLRQ